MLRATRIGARLIATVGCVVLLFGLGGEDALMRVACAFALAGLTSVAILARRLSAEDLSRTARAVRRVMLFSFMGLIALILLAGGGALNSPPTPDGKYYLRNHSVRTAVSAPIYYVVAAAEIFLFTLWPSGMVLLVRATNYGEKPL